MLILFIRKSRISCSFLHALPESFYSRFPLFRDITCLPKIP